VLDGKRKPIVLDGKLSGKTEIGKDGQITQDGFPAARIGVFDVADNRAAQKARADAARPPERSGAPGRNAQLRSGSVERANVDPTTELASLMDAQRHLEANANMIRYQDAMLGKLVNEVGKI
jgi:flagellar basal body rod protein FlgG